jgi:flagellar L-ring protein precursor FlgH
MTRSILALLTLSGFALAAEKTASPLDRYIEEALKRDPSSQSSPGSLYSPASRMADLNRDLRAVQIDDIVTIVVSDRASAVARGGTTSSRKSSASASVTSLAGPLKAKGPLANLANLNGAQDLKGTGETTRESSLSVTLTARVTHVLPNGYLVLEGNKDIIVNSERQQVNVRGVIRWNDVGPTNSVRSDRLANVEIHVNGKGVVGDAIRRPNILYRILLGILPF